MQTVQVKPTEKIVNKFILNVKKVKLPFEALFKTINRSTVLPVLEDILVARKDGIATFSATDLETIFSISMPDVGGDTSFLFPGMELRYLLQNSLSENIVTTVSGEPDRQQLKIGSGNFKLELTTQRVSEYPILVNFETEKSLTIDVKEFIPFLEKALVFVSHDYLRPSMTGVCFKDWKGFLHLVATDAHRMYFHPICKTSKSYEGCSFILPYRAATILIQAFKSDKEVAIEMGEPHIRVSSDGKRLTTRPIDATYPNFAQVVPTNLPLSIFLNRKELISTIRMCQHFTNKSTQQLVVDVHPDRLDISGGDVDFSFQFTNPIKIQKVNLDTFGPYRFGINCRFWLQALECSKDELTCLETQMHPTKAMIIDSHVLIMPLMLNA